MIKRLLKTVILLALVGGVAVWGYFAVRNRDISINQWFVGGLELGVDVSSYQTDVDFGKLMEQGVKFAYIKATEGSLHTDGSFAEKWAAAGEAGMPVGAYHYFSYESSGVKQAENFINTVGKLSGVDGNFLIPAIDMELSTEQKANPPEKSEVVAALKAFLAVLEEEYGVKPLIYAERGYYDQYLAEDFSDYPRWVRNVFYPVWVDAGEGWLVWQYNDKGVLDGYGGEKYIDLNVINGKYGLEAIRVK